MLNSKRLTIFCSLFLVLFLFFSWQVSTGVYTQLDLQVTLLIQNLLPVFVAIPFSVFSLIGTAEFTLPLLALICLILVTKKRLKEVSVIIIFFSIGSLVEIICKNIIFQPNPPIELYRGVFHFSFPSYGVVETSYAYPSGHVFRTGFLILVFIHLLKMINYSKIKTVRITLTIFLYLMIISRVYLGEHWPSDVIGGGILGTTLGVIAGRFLKPSTTN